MKASELITVLQNIIEAEGDIEVTMQDDEIGGDDAIVAVITRQEEASFMEKEPRPDNRVVSLSTYLLTPNNNEKLYFKN